MKKRLYILLGVIVIGFAIIYALSYILISHQNQIRNSFDSFVQKTNEQQSDIKIINVGSKDDWIILRYVATEDQVSRLYTQKVDTQVSQDSDIAWKKTVSKSDINMEADMIQKTRPYNDSFLTEFQYQRYNIQVSNLDPTSQEQVQNEATALSSLQNEIEYDNSGKIISIRSEINGDKELYSQSIKGVIEWLQSMFVRFPNIKMWVGGSWIVTGEVEIQWFKNILEKKYTITKIDNNSVFLDFIFTEDIPEQIYQGFKLKPWKNITQWNMIVNLNSIIPTSMVFQWRRSFIFEWQNFPLQTTADISSSFKQVQ